MDIPETRYATTEEGISIAYQTVGDGPVDLVLDTAIFGNVEIMWELAPLADLFAQAVVVLALDPARLSRDRPIRRILGP